MERIKVGGMAEIWRARSCSSPDGRIVAIKRILPHLIADRQYVAMFLDESRLLAQLDHPGIVHTLEVGVVEQTPFIALEFVFGQDGRALLGRASRGNPTPIRTACFIVMQVCEALHYAHQARDSRGAPLGLVHRDVSLQNVLLSYAGEIKLTDFGIARSAESTARTQAGIVKGNLGYMSPEQLRGQPADRRSDVFAAGVCLYELLTSERLFGGASDYASITKLRYAVVPPPSHKNREIPPLLDDVVMRALAKRPEDRFETAAAFAAALHPFVGDGGVAASTEALGAHLRRVFADAYAPGTQTPSEASGLEPSDGSTPDRARSGSDVFPRLENRDAAPGSGLTVSTRAPVNGLSSDITVQSASDAFSGALTPIHVSRIQPVGARSPDLTAREGTLDGAAGAAVGHPPISQRSPPRPRTEPIAYAPVIGAVAAIIAVIVVALALNLRSTPAEIRVEVLPKDADIFVDGRSVPHTQPVVIRDLEPGVPHRIEVQRAGYQPWTATLSLEPRQLLPLPPIRLVALRRAQQAPIPGTLEKPHARH